MIEYMIANNSGDILHDVIETLLMFNQDDINLLISDYYNAKKSIFLYKNDFDLVPNVSATEKKIIYSRGYTVNFSELLYTIASYNDDRYSDLINKFNNKYIYALLVGKDEIDISFINLCFQILSDEDKFNRFIDFDNNRDLFSFNGSYNQEHYMLEMMRYFDENKNFVMLNNIQFCFELVSEDMVERYYKLRDMITVSEKTKQDEETQIIANDGYIYSYHKQRYIDNDWILDKSIEDYVLNDMNSEYSLEEKIAYIYIKLCILLEYEGSYMKDTSVNSLYSKQIMESINTNNPNILCSDFSHMFTKLVNRLDNVDARSVRCGKDARVHEYTALLIKDKEIRINFEPIDVRGNFNDLTSAKLGIDLQGIDYISDSQCIFRDSVKRVYQDLLSQKVVTTYSLINEYEQNYFSNISIDYSDNFNNFINEMRKKKIKGSELIIAFMRMQRVGYFGNIRYSLAFHKQDDGYMERLIIFESNGRTYYFRTGTQEIFEMTKEQLNDLFSKNILIYEDDKYTLEGVGISK